MLKKLASLGGLAGASIAAGIYALKKGNEDRYKLEIPSYKKTAEEVKNRHQDGGLYLVDPENREWWSARGKEFKKFYSGDWQDFRNKCFLEAKSRKSEWDTVLGSNANYYSEASLVPSDNVDFLSLCVKN
ncbi:hypothetical protein HF1_03440 [Mycoplasma haemofelis str. Langford 1]|uniref:Uncharacterized protein n=1 Tax=Mycoplasma haemofelis (strain Langford 1) TaxID=941640 RepID=E8ZGT1_MYCHL|nr:hypothetical protein [Mycoplasma haemofelis]CBY92352.1 hypothetical protein HF1_03440 [Mycoplasma haemofelis str. Langford 1]